MAIYTKQKLSGSINGLPILVAAVATPGTTIHTAVAGTTSYDEVWLWAINTSANSNVKLTIEYGGTTDPNNHLEYYLPAESGLKLVVPGLLIQNALVIGAFASITNVITISGFINNIA